MNYYELAQLTAAESIVVITALVVLAVDLGLRSRIGTAARWGWAVGLGLFGCVMVGVWMVVRVPDGAVGGGMYVSDGLTRWVKGVLVALGAGSLLLSSRGTFTTHVGEYVAVVLFGLVGMMLVASSENVLMMFLALELTSLSLYILAAFAKDDAAGTEGALKYFLFGGMAGAFLLFGLSLVYGVTGAIEFRLIAMNLADKPFSPLLVAGLVMVLVGLGFKVAAVPFHFWAPDAYQGAPTPVAGFIAAGSKVAAFFVLAKLSVVALASVRGSAAWGAFVPTWSPLVAVVAAASMVVGNLAALRQRNVKRLLAYSAVAHAGYTLTAVVAGDSAGFSAVVFYAVTYAVTALGAFGVVGMVESATGGSDREHFAGLSRRSPGLAICFGVFVLSLAGIPPLAGFFGKFYLFLAAAMVDGGRLGLLWLVGLGAATTCISFYYYLRLLKAVFVEEPVLGGAGTGGQRSAGFLEWITVAAAAVVVVVAGCVPAWVLNPIQTGLVAVGL